MTDWWMLVLAVWGALSLLVVLILGRLGSRLARHRVNRSSHE